MPKPTSPVDTDKNLLLPRSLPLDSLNLFSLGPGY